eukprot:jgi/Mesen1/7622/ME000004S07898
MTTDGYSQFADTWRLSPARRTTVKEFPPWDMTGDTKGRSLVDLSTIPDQRARVLLLGGADVHHVLCTAAANSPSPAPASESERAGGQVAAREGHRHLEFHLHDSCLPQLARAALLLFTASASRGGGPHEDLQEADVSFMWALLYHDTLIGGETSTLRSLLRLLINELQKGSGSRLVVPAHATRQALAALLGRWEASCRPGGAPLLDRWEGVVLALSNDGGRHVSSVTPAGRGQDSSPAQTPGEMESKQLLKAMEDRARALAARAFPDSAGAVRDSTRDLFVREVVEYYLPRASCGSGPCSCSPGTDAGAGRGAGSDAAEVQRGSLRDLVVGYRRWQLGRQLSIVLWSGEPLDLCLYTLWPSQAGCQLEDDAPLVRGTGKGAAFGADGGLLEGQGQRTGGARAAAVREQSSKGRELPGAVEEKETAQTRAELTEGGGGVSFDAIDTAHLVGSLGLLNLLACCGPLLKEQVSLRLWTVSADWLDVGPTYKEYLIESLGCDVRLLPSLLGLRLCSDIEFGTTSPRLFAGQAPMEQFTAWGPATLEPRAELVAPGGADTSTCGPGSITGGEAWGGGSSREMLTPLTLVRPLPRGSREREDAPCGITEALRCWHIACYLAPGGGSYTPLTFLLLLLRLPPGLREKFLPRLQGEPSNTPVLLPEALLGWDTAAAFESFQLGTNVMLTLLASSVGSESQPWSRWRPPSAPQAPAVLYSGKLGDEWVPCDLLCKEPASSRSVHLRVYLVEVRDDRDLKQQLLQEDWEGEGEDDGGEREHGRLLELFKVVVGEVRACLRPWEEPARKYWAAAGRFRVHLIDGFRFAPDDASLLFALPANHGLPPQRTLVILMPADNYYPIGQPTPLSDFKSMSIAGGGRQALPGTGASRAPSKVFLEQAAKSGSESVSGLLPLLYELRVQPVGPGRAAAAEALSTAPPAAAFLRVSCLSEYADCYRGTVSFAPGAQGEVRIVRGEGGQELMALHMRPYDPAVWCPCVFLGSESVTLRLACPVLLGGAALRVSRRRGTISCTLPKAPFWPPAGGRWIDCTAMPTWHCDDDVESVILYRQFRLQYSPRELRAGPLLRPLGAQPGRRVVDDVRQLAGTIIKWCPEHNDFYLRFSGGGGQPAAELYVWPLAILRGCHGAPCMVVQYFDRRNVERLAHEWASRPPFAVAAEALAAAAFEFASPRDGGCVLDCEPGALEAIRRLLLWNARPAGTGRLQLKPGQDQERERGGGPEDDSIGVISFLPLVFPDAASASGAAEESVLLRPAELAFGGAELLRRARAGSSEERHHGEARVLGGAKKGSARGTPRSTSAAEGTGTGAGKDREEKNGKEKGEGEREEKGGHGKDSLALLVKVCATCGKTGGSVHRCSRCKGPAYCSKECQKLDWPQHKQHCNKEDST